MGGDGGNEGGRRRAGACMLAHTHSPAQPTHPLALPTNRARQWIERVLDMAAVFAYAAGVLLSKEYVDMKKEQKREQKEKK